MTSTLQSKRRRWQLGIQAGLLIVVLCLLLLGWLAVRMQRAKERQARTDEQTNVLEKIAHLAPHPGRPSENGNFEDLFLHSPANGEKIGEELAVLKDIPALQILYLPRTRVANAALAHLQAVPALRVLHLEDASVSDKGLVHLGKIKGLEILDLERTKITDAGLVHLKSLRTLKTLRLNGTTIGDGGVRHLVDLPNLLLLDLSRTQVTNDVLACLRSMPTLKEVCLDDSKVTKEGAEAIKKTLPGVKIVWHLPIDPSRRPVYRGPSGNAERVEATQ